METLVELLNTTANIVGRNLCLLGPSDAAVACLLSAYLTDVSRVSWGVLRINAFGRTTYNVIVGVGILSLTLSIYGAAIERIFEFDGKWKYGIALVVISLAISYIYYMEYWCRADGRADPPPLDRFFNVVVRPVMEPLFGAGAVLLLGGGLQHGFC
jgi:hypothetical protein